jgi:hypothetical protein
MHEHHEHCIQIADPTLTDEEQPVLQRAFDRMTDAQRETPVELFAHAALRRAHAPRRSLPR